MYWAQAVGHLMLGEEQDHCKAPQQRSQDIGNAYIGTRDKASPYPEHKLENVECVSLIELP